MTTLKHSSTDANQHKIPIKYKFNTKLLSSITSLNEIPKENTKSINKEFYKAVKTFIEESKLDRKISFNTPNTINSLYLTLNHFMLDKCLIAINNFEGIDIQPTALYPVTLRQFDLSLHLVVYSIQISRTAQYLIDVIWTPNNLISQLNGNFSLDLYVRNVN